MDRFLIFIIFTRKMRVDGWRILFRIFCWVRWALFPLYYCTVDPRCQCCGAGAGIFSWSRGKSSGSGLLLFGLGALVGTVVALVKFSHISTTYTQIERKRGTLKKNLNYWLLFSKLHFLLKLVLQKCYQEPKPVAGTGAGQDWTGSTTLLAEVGLLIVTKDAVFNIIGF